MTLFSTSTARIVVSLSFFACGACSSTDATRDAARGAEDAAHFDVGPLPDANHSAPLPVELGDAGHFVVLAMSGVSSVPTSAITGDVAVSPGAATLITGFSLVVDAGGAFSTSSQVTGRVFASDYGAPTPSQLTTAISDMQLAFAAAAGRAPDVTELGAGDIGGTTLSHGVYRWSSGLSIPTDVTLAGSTTDVWIFQVAQDLTLANGARVSLTGGALARNVFWQVSGAVHHGTTSHCEGVVLSRTAITLGTGASVVGRLLAQTAIDVDGSTVVEPML
jgi:hypothetical protein